MKVFLPILLVTVINFHLTSSLSPFQGVKYGSYSNSINTNIGQQPDTQNVFDVVYQWKILDFRFPTRELRDEALESGEYIPQNNLPLGLDVWRDRLFITTPRWKNGVPASLTWLPLPSEPNNRSPPLLPYPNWAAHSTISQPNCRKLLSVYRIFIDECERLWVLDAGMVNATILPNQLCLPKIVIYDLNTDQELGQYELPSTQVKEDSLHTNIIVDVRNGQCNDAHAYVTDVWRNGIVVYSLAKNRSWRTTSHLYLPTPAASDYTLHGLNFQWTDGVFGTTLSPVDQSNDRTLFYHPMSSFTEYTVPASILQNETLWTVDNGLASAFQPLGSRGLNGQSSTSGIDRNNVMFFNLVVQDAVGCWDTRKPYAFEQLGIVERNSTTLVFPNDLKIDHENDQGLWVLSNRLPTYLYSQLNFNDINFRIQRVGVFEAVQGTICDPRVAPVLPVGDKCYN